MAPKKPPLWLFRGEKPLFPTRFWQPSARRRETLGDHGRREKVAAGRRSSTPHFASLTLGYLGLISETWRPTPRFASPTLGRRSETWRRLVAPPGGGARLNTLNCVSGLKPPRNVASRGVERPRLFGSEEASAPAFSGGKSTLSHSVLATQRAAARSPR